MKKEDNNGGGGSSMLSKHSSSTLLTRSKRLTLEFREAIKHGKSPYPHENPQLLASILKAIDENIAWPNIQKILRDCCSGLSLIVGRNCHLLQLKYQRKISLLLAVHTKNLPELKSRLKPLLKSFNTQWEIVIDDFAWNVVIQALASYRTLNKFTEFEKRLAQDAIDCRANYIEIVDYSTGHVYFKCEPWSLPEVVQALEQREYKIFYSDYGFRAREEKTLSKEEYERYKKFIRTLATFRNIDKIYDNCANKRSSFSSSASS